MIAAYAAATDPDEMPPYNCGKWNFYVEYETATVTADANEAKKWVVYNSLGASYPDITGPGKFTDIVEHTIRANIPEDTTPGTYTYKLVGEFFLESLKDTVSSHLPVPSSNTKRVSFDIEVTACEPRVDCSAHTPITDKEINWYGTLASEFAEEFDFSSVISECTAECATSSYSTLRARHVQWRPHPSLDWTDLPENFDWDNAESATKFAMSECPKGDVTV
jgi:hypothetical protein